MKLGRQPFPFTFFRTGQLYRQPPELRHAVIQGHVSLTYFVAPKSLSMAWLR